MEHVLTEQERAVIRLRFGFHGLPLVLREIGERMGISRERVRQIELQAKMRLGKAFRAMNHPLAQGKPDGARDGGKDRWSAQPFGVESAGRITFEREPVLILQQFP